LGGGVVDGEMLDELELAVVPRSTWVDGEPAMVGKFILADSCSLLVLVRGVCCTGAAETEDRLIESTRRAVVVGNALMCSGGSCVDSGTRNTSP
jgi:hypothetical protein